VRRVSAVRIVELLVVAVLGGVLALLGASFFGKLGDHTTIQQVSPLGGNSGINSSAPLVPTTAKGLTPEQIYKRDAPGVVQIEATTTQADPFGTPQTEQSLGSGFVVDKTGHVVTNYHVVQNAQKLQVSFSGNDKLNATVVGSDPSTDIAVIKIDARARALTPLPLGNSDSVVVGDTVYAIGNPFGFTRTLTSGLVSAVQRQIEAPNTLSIDHVIQTDAAINHGNSGGPLLDTAGRVIGVTSQISTGNTGQQGNIGIGFAIPINTVRNVAAQLIKSGRVEHAFLGVTTVQLTPRLAKAFNLPTETGLLLTSVTTGSGADKAGLRPGKTQVVVQGESYLLGGDIIVGIDETPTPNYEALRDAVSQKRPGDKVDLKIYRDGAKKTVTVTLGQAPR
jgi:S1-C subfamily serine protease